MTSAHDVQRVWTFGAGDGCFGIAGSKKSHDNSRGKGYRRHSRKSTHHARCKVGARRKAMLLPGCLTIPGCVLSNPPVQISQIPQMPDRVDLPGWSGRPNKKQKNINFRALNKHAAINAAALCACAPAPRPQQPAAGLAVRYDFAVSLKK